jgi:ABC-type multidrug transport system fused ATPase/permease subunit
MEKTPKSPIRLVLSTAGLVLTRKEKVQMVTVGLVVLVGIGLELVALGLFVPIIGVLTNGESLEDVRARFEILQDLSDNSVLLVILAIIAGVYLVKNVYAVGAMWFQRTVVAQISTRLSTTLFQTYVCQPYEFHLKSNSSVLIRNMQNAATLVSSGIDPLIGLISDSLITAGIVILLIVVAPVPSLFVIVVMGFFGFLLHRLVKTRVMRLGAQRNIHNAKLLQYQHQGLGSIKTLKVTGREALFIQSYEDQAIQNSLVNRTYGLLQQIPRLWIEMLTVLGLSGLVIILAAQGESPSSAVPILGLFGVAAFRVQPSITRVLLSLQSLTFSSAAIDSVRSDFMLGGETTDDENESSVDFERIIFDDVKFAYSSRSQPVLEGVSIQIRRGEHVGISGRSGAGKSTLVDLTLGLLEPTSGTIRLDERDLQTCRRGWQRQIGYVPQEIFLVDDSIAQNVSFGLPLTQEVMERVSDALVDAQLGEFIGSLPDGIETIVGEMGVRLSGGQRQRVGIARALVGSPAVLIFDEATSSLDPETEREFLSAIDAVSPGRTVIVIAHRVTTLARCDRILRVEGGKVLDLGRPTPQLLDQLAGEPDGGA